MNSNLIYGKIIKTGLNLILLQVLFSMNYGYKASKMQYPAHIPQMVKIYV